MDAERRRRHQPSIEASCGDDPFAIQDAGARGWHGLIECRRHLFPPRIYAFMARYAVKVSVRASRINRAIHIAR
jgi:hypothetical protein